jgi:serine/threonine protein kinase
MNDLQYITNKGHGYFCQVKLYRHVHTGHEFAFKELKKEHYPKDEYRYRLNREINMLKELQGCEHIISLLDHGENKDKESLWYLMPYAPANLFNYIRKHNSTLSPKERFAIIDQVIDAVKYAHERSILHRDISPNNVLVFFENDQVIIKVADFGLGKDAESISHYTASSASGYGQILYVSPEQRQKLKDATFQSDIYSLGKLVYFIYTGRDPDNIKQFELSTLVSRATEEKPEDRFKNIQEFEQHYTSLKELQLNTNIPMEYITLLEVAESGEEIDFHYLHKLLVQGNVFQHVYSDYIAPVVKLFENTDYFRRYYATVGSSIVEFVATLSERLEECYNSVGWPFKAAGGFGTLLKKIFLIVPDYRVRLSCLKFLWKLAFEMDQWSVQRDIAEVLQEKYLSNAIASPFAEFIVNSEIEVDLQHFQALVLPKVIKMAIINGNQIVKTKLEAQKAAHGLYDSPDF